jgi:hypothetical protein
MDPDEVNDQGNASEPACPCKPPLPRRLSRPRAARNLLTCVVVLGVALVMAVYVPGTLNSNGTTARSFHAAGGPQTLSIRTLGGQAFLTDAVSAPQTLTAVAGVSVQGIMQLPPSLGSGFASLFSGITNSSGTFVVNNTTAIDELASTWSTYQTTHNNAFTPYIVVLLTYETGGANYTSQTSINLAPEQLLGGQSYSAVASLPVDTAHHIVPDHSVKSRNLAASNNTNNSTSGIPHATGELQPSDLSSPLPSQFGTCSEVSGNTCWIEQNSSEITAPGGASLQIPLAVGQATGAAEVEAELSMGETSTSEMGSILNPFSLGTVQVTTGSSNGGIDAIFNASWDPKWQTAWSYMWISGDYSYANYQLYELEGNAATCSRYGLECPEWYPQGQYQSLTGLTQINTKTYNGTQYIIGGVVEAAIPTSYELNTNYLQYESASGTPVSGLSNTYELTSTYMYSSTWNLGDLAGILLGIGATILGLASFGEVDAAVVAAGVVASALGVTVGVIQWGGSSSADIYSGVEYSSSDGQTPTAQVAFTNAPLIVDGDTVEVPVLVVKVYAPLPSSESAYSQAYATTFANTSTTEDVVFSPSFATQVGDLIVVSTADCTSGTAVTVSDSQGNTWVSVGNHESGTTLWADGFYAVSTGNGTDVLTLRDATYSQMSAQIVVYSGIGTPASAGSWADSGTSTVTPSVTTTAGATVIALYSAIRFTGAVTAPGYTQATGGYDSENVYAAQFWDTTFASASAGTTSVTFTQAIATQHSVMLLSVAKLAVVSQAYATTPSNTSTTKTSVTSPSFVTQVGDLIVVSTADYTSGPAVTVSDSEGDAWISVGSHESGTTLWADGFYAVAKSNGIDTLTLNDTTSSQMSAQIVVYSGIGTLVTAGSWTDSAESTVHPSVTTTAGATVIALYSAVRFTGPVTASGYTQATGGYDSNNVYPAQFWDTTFASASAGTTSVAFSQELNTQHSALLLSVA